MVGFGSPLTYLVNLMIIVLFLQFEVKFWGVIFVKGLPYCQKWTIYS